MGARAGVALSVGESTGVLRHASTCGGTPRYDAHGPARALRVMALVRVVGAGYACSMSSRTIRILDLFAGADECRPYRRHRRHRHKYRKRKVILHAR